MATIDGQLTTAAGIDLSARRGLDLALLTPDRALICLEHLTGIDEVAIWLQCHAPDAVVGIDAPQGPRLPLMRDPVRRARLQPVPADGRYERHRVCDYELARRGINLYLSPAAGEAVPDWIAVGFELFDTLQQQGRRKPGTPTDSDASLLEVYPFATFVCLLDGIPPPKSSRQGLEIRRTALEQAGVTRLPAHATHDQLDAIACALTVGCFQAGKGCAVGDPEEGLMGLPVPIGNLRDHYRRLLPWHGMPGKQSEPRSPANARLGTLDHAET